MNIWQSVVVLFSLTKYESIINHMWDREFYSNSSSSIEEKNLELSTKKSPKLREESLRDSKIVSRSGSIVSSARQTNDIRPRSSYIQMKDRMKQVTKKKEVALVEDIDQNPQNISAILMSAESTTKFQPSVTPANKETELKQYQPSALVNRVDILPDPIKALSVNLRDEFTDFDVFETEKSTLVKNEPIQNTVEEEVLREQPIEVNTKELESESAPGGCFKLENEEISSEELETKKEESFHQDINAHKNEYFSEDSRSHIVQSELYENESEISVIEPEIPTNKPIEEPKVTRNPKPHQTVNESSFLTTPVSKYSVFQCTVRKEKSGFAGLISKYYMHMSDNWEFLLAAKKGGLSQSSTYSITSDQNDFTTKSEHYLGKLKSNFVGTTFHLYNEGLNPSFKKANFASYREELMVILYQINILGKKGPRKMRVVIPSLHDNNLRHLWKPKNKKEGMLEQLKKGNSNGMTSFYNKMPQWDDRTQMYILNFNGRVDKASTRNFQLVDKEDNVILQFGKRGNEFYNLDFTWPFSPIQALACALSSIDNKLLCE